ncbi:hypothetical protein NHQ30_009512 [Ciborinia camelliae]|nr:hypothetical protein NHQ30_009512 [Ciborinia camelliae]
MNRHPGGPLQDLYLRPPSSRPRPRQNLPITTPTPSLSRQTSSPSSSQPSINAEKKPIPPKKLQHASKLYSEFRMKEGLALRSPDPNATSPNSIGSYDILSPPGALTNGSRSSIGKNTPSFDAVSEFSSVMSFGTGSQSSTKSGPKNQAFSYKGNAVTQRTRRKFDPVSRAKTALIRYIGACQNCKDRNVPCPLEHHDIESLDHAYRLRSIKQEVDSQYHNPKSPIHESEIENTLSGQATPISSHGQHEELRGIGGGFGVSPEGPIDSELMIFSPGASDLEFNPAQNIYGFSSRISLEARVATHYSSCQNGGQFPLGVWKDPSYKCYFLDGECSQSFADAGALQTHFEIEHFEFTRINPCFRWICTQCWCVNGHHAHSCDSCGGMVEVFICGNFIRIPSYPPEPPSRQPYYYTESNTPAVYSDPSYSSSDFEQGLGFNVNEAQNFDNNVNINLYGNGSNMYPSPNRFSGGFDAYTYDSTQPGGNRYNGYAWTLTQGANKAAAIPIRYCVMKFRRASEHQKILISILLFFVLIITGLQLYHWIASTIISKIDQFLPSIPTLGFMGFLVSFVTSWAARHIHSIHKAKRCKMRRCPLHAFTPLADQYGQRLPPVLMHARV